MDELAVKVATLEQRQTVSEHRIKDLEGEVRDIRTLPPRWPGSMKRWTGCAETWKRSRRMLKTSQRVRGRSGTNWWQRRSGR